MNVLEWTWCQSKWFRQGTIRTAEQVFAKHLIATGLSNNQTDKATEL
jgi:hypothetical protein